MLLWSYFSVVFTDPGRVPSNWMPKIDEERGDDADPLVDSSASSPRDLNVVTGEPEHRRIRYCRKCNQFKPPRCHHCSVCEFFMLLTFMCLLLFLGTLTNASIGLFFRWQVRSENGPSLHLGCELCGRVELQVFSSFLGM